MAPEDSALQGGDKRVSACIHIFRKDCGEKNSALWDLWVTYCLVSRLPPWLRGASNKMIGDYVVMRFIGAKLAFLLDTSDGIISLYKGAYGDSAPRFLIWGSHVRIMVGGRGELAQPANQSWSGRQHKLRGLRPLATDHRGRTWISAGLSRLFDATAPSDVCGHFWPENP